MFEEIHVDEINTSSPEGVGKGSTHETIKNIKAMCEMSSMPTLMFENTQHVRRSLNGERGTDCSQL